MAITGVHALLYTSGPDALRWFTVFFLPLVPLGQQGEWVQCQSCGATYDPALVQQQQHAPHQG